MLITKRLKIEEEKKQDNIIKNIRRKLMQKREHGIQHTTKRIRIKLTKGRETTHMRKLVHHPIITKIKTELMQIGILGLCENVVRHIQNEIRYGIKHNRRSILNG